MEKPKIQIGDYIIPQYYGFSQRVSISEFQDALVLQLGDPITSLLFDKVNTNFIAKTFVRGVEDEFRIFELHPETDQRGKKNLVCNGFSLALEPYLNDATPVKYTDTTDNQIISEQLADFDLVLEEAMNIEEFDVSAGQSKLDVAKAVADRNGFNLYFSGGKIYKKATVQSGASVKTYIDEEITSEGIGTVTRVFPQSIRMKKDITRVRSQIQAYGTKKNHDLFSRTIDVNPTSVFSGEAINVDRKMIISSNAKDDGELQENLERNIYKAQPLETLSFDVRGRDTIELNDIVDIKFNQYKLNLQMYLYAKEFKDFNSDARTTLSFAGLGRHFN